MIKKFKETSKTIRPKKKEKPKKNRRKGARPIDKECLIVEKAGPNKKLQGKSQKGQRRKRRKGFQPEKKVLGDLAGLASSLIRMRREIDRVDKKILALLERRFALAISTVKSKSRLRDKEREEAIIAGLMNRVACSPYLTWPFVKKVYGLIFNQSVALEKRYRQELAAERKNNRKKRV